jgi:GT2 family glycosyltransferase
VATLQSNFSDLQFGQRPVTVVVLNYNGKHFLKDCLASLLKQTYAPYEVVLVDNASADGSVDFVRREFPEVRVVESGANLGYCGGNNLGMRSAHTGLVALLNNDTIVAPDWLSRLVAGLASRPDARLASGKVLLHDDPGRVHYAGSTAHFLGQISNTYYLQPDTGGTEPEEVGVYVGSNVLIDVERLGETAYLDDDFFIYMDELDLSLRVRAQGYSVVYVPTAVVYHKAGTPGLAVRGGRGYPRPRAFLVSRNRLLTIAKNYSSSTVLAILPTLAVYEALWATMLAFMGYMGQYFRAWRWLLREWPCVRATRRCVQTLRRRPDRQLLAAGPFTPVPSLFRSPAGRLFMRLASLKLRVYWACVRWMC